MDITETPHAEDFVMELDRLVDRYRKLGLKSKVIVELMQFTISELTPKIKKKSG